VRTEKDILSMVDCSFVVKLIASFQTRGNLFLVMEYIPGGDLFSLLQLVGSLKEPDAKKCGGGGGFAT
jgi:serine/threonine protein kinase